MQPLFILLEHFSSMGALLILANDIVNHLQRTGRTQLDIRWCLRLLPSLYVLYCLQLCASNLICVLHSVCQCSEILPMRPCVLQTPEQNKGRADAVCPNTVMVVPQFVSGPAMLRVLEG